MDRSDDGIRQIVAAVVLEIVLVALDKFEAEDTANFADPTCRAVGD